MNKKYGSVSEASLAVVKYTEDMDYVEKEIAALKRQLENKQEFYDFLKQQRDAAEDEAFDTELTDYIDSLNEEDPDIEHNQDYLRNLV